MKLGKIQKLIVKNLYRVGDTGMWIGSTTKCRDFAGLDLEQVERSLEGLKKQRIIYRQGIVTKLMPWVYAKYSADDIARLTR